MDPEFNFIEKFVRPLQISTEADAKKCSIGTECKISGWGETEVNFDPDNGGKVPRGKEKRLLRQ